MDDLIIDKKKPKFNPDAPYQEASQETPAQETTKPKFDPTKEFTVLKKKELADQNQETGSNESQELGEPSSKSTESTKDNLRESIYTGTPFLGYQNLIGGALYDLGKKALSVFKHDVPASYHEMQASQENTEQSFIDKTIADRSYDEVKAEHPEWFTGPHGGLNVKSPKFQEDFTKYKTEQGAQKAAEFTKSSSIREEGQKFLSGVPKNWDEAKNQGVKGIASYIGNALGQGLGQIPLAAVTLGGSSYYMEKGDSYQEAVHAIAKETGKKPEEVIKSGEDKPAQEISDIVGAVNGAMDVVSLGGVLKTITSPAKQLVKGLAKKEVQQLLLKNMAKKGAQVVASTATEVATEWQQEMDTQLGALYAAKGQGKDLSDFILHDVNYDDVKKGGDIDYGRNNEAARQALIATGPITVIGSALTAEQKAQPTDEVIQDQTKSVDKTDVASIEAASKVIQEKVDQTNQQDNASTVLQDQGAVPQGGQAIEGSQENRGNDVQQNQEPQQKVNAEVEQQGGLTPQQVINKKLDDLVASGDITREGNKITIVTEKGGKEAKDAYDEFNKSKEVIQPEAPPRTPKELKIGQRIMESDANEAIKKGLQEKGIEYIPKGIEVTDKEAKDLIELYGHDKAETIVRDTKNNITADTRTALAARLYESYKDQADKATDPVVKQQLYNKAVDVALFGAEQAKESGRAVNAAKIWKSITSDEDMMVMAFEQQNKNVANSLVQPIQEKVTKSKQEFDEEISKIIAQKVTEGVESRLEKAKLITKEKKAEINDFFESLKVKDVKGTANDVVRVLGAAVWNGSIEAVKRAVLTGADVANAIQAGVDYIKENYKGADFKEEDYRAAITAGVEKMVPKETIKPEQIDESKINTPKITGKKKKDFISQVVQSYNDGELTSDKFEELYAKQIGYKEYTDTEREQIRSLSKVISEAEKFTTEVQDNFTRENIDKYNDLLKKAQIANKKMQEFARKPNDIYDTLITIMQGNLLTPLSLVTNVYSNLLLQPLRFTSTAVGSVLDTGLSQVAKTGLLGESFKDKTIDLVALQKGFFPAGWNGTMEGLRQLKTGSLADERELREIQSAFNPLKAIERWADGNRTVEQKANDYIEGTFGIPAEVMFRLLNLGDKPFKRAAENARAVELGTLQGLKGNDLLKFIMFPDEKSQEQIKKAGQQATFQEETELSKGIQKGITWVLNYVAKAPYVGGVAKVILKSQVPYVKTPLNIVLDSMDYAIPPLSLAKGLISYSKGDKRNGNISVSKAIVGTMIIASAKMLFQLGLLSPDEDDEKKGKPKSARNLQFDTVPPNSINISAINRILTGGGAEIKDNDIWVNYKKMGITGIILDIHANESFKQLKQTGQVNTGWNELASDMFTSAPSVFSSALDQSFLKGTNSFLNSIQDAGGYETQQWAIETTGAIASIVYPNTVATVSKSNDEYVRDTYDKDFIERLQNTYKTKLFIGDQLPPKVNLWGEKITGNPEGRDKFTYYLFDPTKFKSVDTDSYKYKLYNEWKNDAYNDDWLPNIPSRSLSVKGTNIPLTGPEYAKFCEYVGKERAILTQAYINSLGFEATKKEKKLERLEKIYNKSREIGKRKFLINTGWNVLTKEKLEKLNN